MHNSLATHARGADRFQLDAINAGIAGSMLGRMVSVRTGAKPTQGIVTGIVLENGHPKIVINKFCYDLSRVLTVTPPALQ